MDIIFKDFPVQFIVPKWLACPEKCVGHRTEGLLKVFQFCHVLCKVRRWPWTKLAGAIKYNGFVLISQRKHGEFPSPKSWFIWHYLIPYQTGHIILCLFDLFFSYSFA